MKRVRASESMEREKTRTQKNQPKEPICLKHYKCKFNPWVFSNCHDFLVTRCAFFSLLHYNYMHPILKISCYERHAIWMNFASLNSFDFWLTIISFCLLMIFNLTRGQRSCTMYNSQFHNASTFVQWMETSTKFVFFIRHQINWSLAFNLIANCVLELATIPSRSASKR